MNKIKENAHIKINQGKIPEDVIRELAITFLEGARKFYSNQENVQKFKEWQCKCEKVNAFYKRRRLLVCNLFN